MKLEVIRRYYDKKLEKTLNVGEKIEVSEERGEELLGNPYNIVKRIEEVKLEVKDSTIVVETAMKEIDDKLEDAAIKLEKAETKPKRASKKAKKED